MSKRRNHHNPARFRNKYTTIQMLGASPTDPFPVARRIDSQAGAWDALTSLQAGKPSIHDWRILIDKMNLLDTLVQQGTIQHNYLFGNVRHHEVYEVKDPHGESAAPSRHWHAAGSTSNNAA